MIYQMETKWEHALESAIQSVRKLCDVEVCKEVALGLVAYKFLSDSHPDLKRDWTFPLLRSRASDGFLTTDELGETLRAVSIAVLNADDIFDDMEERLKALSSSEDKRGDVLKAIFEALEPFDFYKMNPAVRGAAYARQIEALSANRKAPVSVTPAAISELIAAIVTQGKGESDAISIYDPTMGSASLLLQAGASVAGKAVSYYGQEIDHRVMCIARWNFLLHGIASEAAHLKEGDTLAEDWLINQTEGTPYDVVVMNPPYGARWAADPHLVYDPRFIDVGILPPRTHADNAFLLHGLYHLKDDGTMAILLPHGVLFHGGPDGKIRQYLIEHDIIDAIIGLPANVFFGVRIPSILMVLKKQRQSRDILMIDASKEYEQGRLQNNLTKNNTQRIISAYLRREEETHFCHITTLDEIRANNYNLNIPRYVDTFVPAPECDIAQLTNDMAVRRNQMKENKAALIRAIEQLAPHDECTLKEIQAFQNMLK